MIELKTQLTAYCMEFQLHLKLPKHGYSLLLGIWQASTPKWSGNVILRITTNSISFLPMTNITMYVQVRLLSLESAVMSLRASQYSMAFLMRPVVILPNMIFKSCVIKCVTIWKIFITQQINSCQMINTWWYKIMLEKIY